MRKLVWNPLILVVHSDCRIEWIKIIQPLFAQYANAYSSESYLQSLQHKVHIKTPFNVSVLSSITLLSPALFQYRYYINIHLYDWNWDCCGLVVMKYGGSTDCWMY